MSYFNKLVRLNLKKYKKSYLSLFTVIVLACTFTITVTVLHDSMIKTEEQQRKDIYGSWHISVYNTDDSLYKDLKNHGTIKSIGKMTGYGEVLRSNGSTLGVIGSVDKNTAHMGLSLLDGRLPVKDNEVAIEMAYLSMMGYSYVLGQEITLKIRIHNNNSQEVITRNFILTGVLKNYSSIWKTDGNQLISFFVTDTSLKTPVFFENIFGIIKNKFVENTDELSMLTLNRGKFIKNDYTYFEYIKKSREFETFLSDSILIILVTITSAFFIFQILYSSQKKHNKSFVIMRCLGASKAQIFSLYFKELLIVFSIAYTAGIIIVLLAVYLGYQLVSAFFPQEFIISINSLKLITLLLILIGFTILFALCSVLRIRQMPLTGNLNLQPVNRIIPLHKRKFRPLTVRNMVKIFNRFHSREAIVYFCLTISTFLVLVSTAYWTYQKYKDYTYIKNTFTADYEYGNMATYYEPQVHMSEEEVERIRNIYGIAYVRAYQITKYLPITWNGIEKSKYADCLKFNYYPRYAKKSGTFATVFGLLQDERDYQFYLDEIDEGNLSADAFLHGNEVIVYLPAYYKMPDGIILNSLDAALQISKSSLSRVTEDTLKIGDEIIINGARGEVKVKIGGIIYEIEHKNSQALLSKPYSIICNDSIYEKLVSAKDIKSYEYLQIYANRNANYERTDVEISKLEKEYIIQNIRIQKEDAKYNARISLFISLLLNSIVLIITITVQCNNQISRMEADNKRNYILNILGMDRNKLQFLYLYNILKNSFLAVVLGIAIIFISLTAIYLKEFGGLFKSGSILEAGKYTYVMYFCRMPWVYVVYLILGYLLLNIAISYYPLWRYRKIKDNF
ncbi:FtsX-like permease family protein [Anaerocolumna sedimenticola]|uniref:FtsX-like permease family protein n=1 Tax=Anaerocolumna sedimenticola TaxID=2696063 RepID=A0A6P1TJL3_9FIRM|nr:ABC transporter permease [Anaerocolumna sedimenticola]QHQ60096.1 FtsX-like permease family protein [Anaerocolumna sedimenticola]